MQDHQPGSWHDQALSELTTALNTTRYVVLHLMKRQRGCTNGVAIRCVRTRRSHPWRSSRDSSAAW